MDEPSNQIVQDYESYKTPPLPIQQKSSTYSAYRDSETAIFSGSYQSPIKGLKGWNDPPTDASTNVHDDFSVSNERKRKFSKDTDDVSKYIMEPISNLFQILKRPEMLKDSVIPQTKLVETIAGKLEKLENRLISREISDDVMDKLLKIADSLNDKKYTEAEEISTALSRDQLIHGESWSSGLKWLLSLIAKIETTKAFVDPQIRSTID